MPVFIFRRVFLRIFVFIGGLPLIVSQVFGAEQVVRANGSTNPSERVVSNPSDMQDMSADALVSSARLALSLVDTGDFARLWSLSAIDTKKRLPLDAFAKEMKEARASVGHISTRSWVGIARVRYVASSVKDAVPAGFYANVEFASRQLDGGMVFELVTMRIEDDGALKFTGYVPRFKPLDFAVQANDPK